MKSYDEIADEYANKRLIGARTKELMKNPLFKDVAELYAQQRVNEVLDKAAEEAKVKRVNGVNFLPGSGEPYNTIDWKVDKQSILKLKNNEN